jgi:hypothetical protein
MRAASYRRIDLAIPEELSAISPTKIWAAKADVGLAVFACELGCRVLCALADLCSSHDGHQSLSRCK